MFLCINSIIVNWDSSYLLPSIFVMMVTKWKPKLKISQWITAKLTTVIRAWRGSLISYHTSCYTGPQVLRFHSVLLNYKQGILEGGGGVFKLEIAIGTSNAIKTKYKQITKSKMDKNFIGLSNPLLYLTFIFKRNKNLKSIFTHCYLFNLPIDYLLVFVQQ